MEPERCVLGSSSHRRAMIQEAAKSAAAVILDRRVKPADVAREVGMSERDVVCFLRDAADGYVPLGWDVVRRLHRAAFGLAGLRSVTMRHHSSGGMGIVIERATALDPREVERRARERREAELREFERRYACRLGGRGAEILGNGRPATAPSSAQTRGQVSIERG